MQHYYYQTRLKNKVNCIAVKCVRLYKFIKFIVLIDFCMCLFECKYFEGKKLLNSNQLTHVKYGENNSVLCAYHNLFSSK